MYVHVHVLDRIPTEALLAFPFNLDPEPNLTSFRAAAE